MILGISMYVEVGMILDWATTELIYRPIINQYFEDNNFPITYL